MLWTCLHFPDLPLRIFARAGMRPTVPAFRRTVARIAKLGWFAKIYAHSAELIELEREVPELDLGVPIVIDHLGRPDLSETAGPAAIAELLQLGLPPLLTST